MKLVEKMSPGESYSLRLTSSWAKKEEKISIEWKRVAFSLCRRVRSGWMLSRWRCRIDRWRRCGWNATHLWWNLGEESAHVSLWELPGSFSGEFVSAEFEQYLQMKMATLDQDEIDERRKVLHWLNKQHPHLTTLASNKLTDVSVQGKQHWFVRLKLISRQA